MNKDISVYRQKPVKLKKKKLLKTLNQTYINIKPVKTKKVILEIFQTKIQFTISIYICVF